MFRRLLLPAMAALAAAPASAEDAGPIDVEAYRLVFTLNRATKGVAGRE